MSTELTWVDEDGILIDTDFPDAQRLVDAATAVEREACAKIVERPQDLCDGDFDCYFCAGMCRNLAAVIRARGGGHVD